MSVQEYMTSNPVTIPSDATLPAAAELTKISCFRRLPVVQKGHVVGIITDRDIKQSMSSDATSLAIWEFNCLLTKIKVSEIMSHPVYSLSEDASLEYPAERWLHYKIDGKPVIFGDQLRGLLTATDILPAFVGHRDLGGCHV